MKSIKAIGLRLAGTHTTTETVAVDDVELTIERHRQEREHDSEVAASAIEKVTSEIEKLYGWDTVTISHLRNEVDRLRARPATDHVLLRDKEG